MSFSIEPVSGGPPRILSDQQEEHIVALPNAPTGLDELLTHGKWLVVSMAQWSGTDHSSGKYAAKLLRSYRDEVRLGLRLFDYPEENLTWIPGLTDSRRESQIEIVIRQEGTHRGITLRGPTNATPFWVTIADGEFRNIRQGALSKEEIEELVFELLTDEVVE